MSAQGVKQERGVAFGKYTLIAKLATGGMGEIFLARLSGMAGFEKLVVIKRLLPHLAEDAHFVAMLLDEARIAARLSHPNVCQVYDLGEVDGQYYIAMEYLEGVPISQMLQRARGQNDLLDVRMATALLAQSCEGLHHAHELKDRQGEPIGLVHRDVSPSNLFVTAAGVVKVLDFGVAKSQDALARTHTGALKGKYAYMSPEQVLTHPVDRRSDIFSLGIVMFELLTARRLFWRDSEYKMFQAIAEDEIPTVNQFRPDIPPSVSDVVARALSRDPEQRYTSAKELAEALAVAAAPVGGFATGASVADYVTSHFSSQIQERRELVLTAVSTTGGGGDAATGRSPTAATRAAKLNTHRAVGARTSSEDDIDTSAGAPQPLREPLAIDATGDLQALSTGTGWKVVVGALLGVLIAGGAAFAYVSSRDTAAKTAEAPQIRVTKGDVTPVDGTTLVSDTTAAREDRATAARTAAPPDAEKHTEPDSRPPPDSSDSRPKTDEDLAVHVKTGDSLDKVIRKARRSWAACIKRNTFQTASNVEVSISISISKQGRVAGTRVSPSAVSAAPVGRCMLKVARGLRFRSEDGGATVTQSLVIRPVVKSP